MGWDKIVGVCVFVSLISTATMADTPPVVAMSLQKSYVPVGFDDNDRVQVMVTGEFPSTCYKVADSAFEVDEEEKTIEIEQRAYSYGGFCLFIMVPFTQVVDVGMLREGTYKLRDKMSGKDLGTLPVLKAKTASADDYLYAPITDAHIRYEAGKATLHMNGVFTDACTKVKEVLVNYSQDAIMVQPIAVHDSSAPDCSRVRVPFEHTVALRDDLRGVWLLHVRTLDGQAINRMANFPDSCPL